MHLEKILPSLEGLNAGNRFAIMLKKYIAKCNKNNYPYN